MQFLKHYNSQYNDDKHINKQAVNIIFIYDHEVNVGNRNKFNKLNAW